MGTQAVARYHLPQGGIHGHAEAALPHCVWRGLSSEATSSGAEYPGEQVPGGFGYRDPPLPDPKIPSWCCWKAALQETQLRGSDTHLGGRSEHRHTGNLGMFPCCASPPEDRPFRGWVAPIPAPHCLPEMMFCLCVPALSHLFKDVTAHPAAVFSHLSVPTGVSFLRSEQSSEPCGLPTEQRISLPIGAPLKCREAAETP